MAALKQSVSGSKPLKIAQKKTKAKTPVRRRKTA